VELTGFDDDPVAQSVIDGCIVATDPYVARLTYLFRPLEAADTDNATNGAPRSTDDYEWVILGGDLDDSDAGRVRRLITFAVLPALRDAVGGSCIVASVSATGTTRRGRSRFDVACGRSPAR
jgi:hypothetical protein